MSGDTSARTDPKAVPALTAVTLEPDGVVEIALAGDLGFDADPGPLEAALTAAVDQAGARAALRLRLDAVAHYRAGLVAMIAAALHRARDRSQSVTVVFDGASPWQRHAFAALKALAPDEDWLDVRASD